MAINENLRALIRELLEDELKEVSSSGAAGPYMTPKAFGKRKPASGVSKQEEPHEFGGTKKLGEAMDAKAIKNRIRELEQERNEKARAAVGPEAHGKVMKTYNARIQKAKERLSQRDK